MKLLLDTHALLWFAEDSPQMPDHVKAILEDGRNDKFVSVASIWEIAIKYRIGKLALSSPPEKYLPDILSEGGMTIMSVLFDHALLVSKLEMYHKDPFDRLLVSQCLLEDMTLISGDTILDSYGVNRLWDAPRVSE